MIKEDYIEQFFIKDGGELQGGFIRKSVLLSLVEDLKYCLQYPKKFHDIGINDKELILLESIAPTLTICAIFFMGVDVLGRVINKRQPNRQEGKSFFIEALRFYDVEEADEVSALWNLRNDIVHSYRISDGCWISIGGKSIIEKMSANGKWHYCLRPMLGATQKALAHVYKYTTQQNDIQKLSTALYLQDKGFFVTPKIKNKI